MNNNRLSFPNGFEKTEVRWAKIKIKLAPNERFDEGYAKNWGIAVISSKNKGYIQAFATDPNGMRSLQPKK